jgi:hypothetical protein
MRANMNNETERPSIEFDGRRYVRRGGAWYDALSHMKAPAHISQKIDTNAKENPTFWEQCRDQDFSDDPKNRGRIRFSAAEMIDLGLVDDLQPSAGQPRPSENRTRRARVGENVNMSFRNKARELVVRCDIEPGWHETASGWVFQESDRVELPSGHRLRVSAKFVEHTFGQWQRRTTYDGAPRRTEAASLDELPPSFTRAESEITGNIRLAVDGSAATFVIKWLDATDELNAALPWRQVGRDWVFKDYLSGLYEQAVRLNDERSAVARPFYIEIEAVLHEPQGAAPAPEYAERTPFASGGLPSLGKRR